MPPRTRSASRRLRYQDQSDLPLFAQPAPFLVEVGERLRSASQNAGETQNRTRNVQARTRRKLLKFANSDDKLDGHLHTEEEFAGNFDDIMNFHMSITREENDAILHEYRHKLEEKTPEAMKLVGTEKPLRVRDLAWMRFRFEKFRFGPPKPILHTPTIFAWRGWEPPPVRPRETMESILNGPLPPDPPQPLRARQSDLIEKSIPLYTSLPLTLGPSSYTHRLSPLTSSPRKSSWSSLNAVSLQGSVSTSSSQQLPQHPDQAQPPSKASKTKSKSIENPQVKSPEKKRHKSTEKELNLFQRLNGPDGIANPNGPCNYCRGSGKECRVMASEVNMAPSDRKFLRCNHCCRRKAGAEACNINSDEARRRCDERAVKSKVAKAKREGATLSKEASKAKGESRREAREVELKQEARRSKKRPSACSSVVSEEQGLTKRRKTTNITSKAGKDGGKR